LGTVLLLGFAAAGMANETKTYTYDALGRLVAAKSTGTVNNNHTRSTCYDDAGNRTQYAATSNGTVPSCSPTPSPTPTPTNSPPVTQPDSVQVACNATTTVNVTANDSDPEGNLPLTVTAVVVNSGDAFASVASSTSISVTGAWDNGQSIATYTVKDGLNASSTGTLTINTVGGPSICGNLLMAGQEGSSAQTAEETGDASELSE
jgi:hypothetical protein